MLRVFDIQSKKSLSQAKLEGEGVCVDISPNGEFIAVGMDAGKVSRTFSETSIPIVDFSNHI